MSEEFENEPASQTKTCCNSETHAAALNGMSRYQRGLFASAAMQALISRTSPHLRLDYARIAEESYAMAEAMVTTGQRG